MHRHDDAMIKKLKKAGLGYNVGDKDTNDKFGKKPSHLVLHQCKFSDCWFSQNSAVHFRLAKHAACVGFCTG